MAYKDSQRVVREPDGLKSQIVTSGIFVLSICFIVTILFQRIIGLGTRVEALILWTMWITLPLVWAFGSLLSWMKWDKNGYFFTDNALVIQKAMLFGAKEYLYRYDAILSVEVREGMLGKRYGYGSLLVTIPKHDQAMVLQYVSRPREQALTLKKLISAHHPGSGSLVH